MYASRNSRAWDASQSGLAYFVRVALALSRSFLCEASRASSTLKTVAASPPPTRPNKNLDASSILPPPLGVSIPGPLRCHSCFAPAAARGSPMPSAGNPRARQRLVRKNFPTECPPFHFSVPLPGGFRWPVLTRSAREACNRACSSCPSVRRAPGAVRRAGSWPIRMAASSRRWRPSETRSSCRDHEGGDDKCGFGQVSVSLFPAPPRDI